MLGLFGSFIGRAAAWLVAEPRTARLVIVTALLAVLPLPYVALGPRYAPFASDLAAHPDRYRGQDVVLPLTRVLHCGRGWAELGEPGGTVRVAADPRFDLRQDEILNVRLRQDRRGFFVADVGRHPTRNAKWLVSSPVLLAVAALALARVRWDRPRRGLALRGASTAGVAVA